MMKDVYISVSQKLNLLPLILDFTTSLPVLFSNCEV